MNSQVFILLLAVLALGLVPLVPRMVEFRIHVLRWLGLDQIAQFHRKGFRPIVVVVRTILIGIAVILVFEAFAV